MLESEPRRLLLVTVLAGLVALAPLASANGSPEDATLQEVQERAPDGSEGDGVRDEAADRMPEPGTEYDGTVHDVVDPEGDEASEVRQAARERAPQTGTAADPVLGDALADGTVEAAIQRVHDEALKTLADTLGLLPDDPIDFVDDSVRPIAASATEIFGPEAHEVEDAEPASGDATVVPMSLPAQLLVAGAGAAAAAALIAVWLAGSSGSISAGAGAAGTAGAGKAAAGSSDLRRLLPFASPLFTRFEKDTVLGHPKREALYALILQDPGVSLQALCDATGLSRTAVTHHLRLLEMQHLIVSKRMGRSRHYYENGGRFGRDQKDAYAVLHNGRSKDVARFVKDNPGAIQKQLCEALGIQPSIAHWHLRRLQQAQLVEAVRQGRTVSYYPGPAYANLERAAIPRADAAPAPPSPQPQPMAVPLRLNLPLPA